MDVAADVRAGHFRNAGTDAHTADDSLGRTAVDDELAVDVDVDTGEAEEPGTESRSTEDGRRECRPKCPVSADAVGGEGLAGDGAVSLSEKACSETTGE